MIRLRFHHEAAAEYESAIDWYAARSPASALSFADAVAHALASIQRFPRAWPPYRPGSRYRVRTLPRHRHSIVYLLRDDEIVIMAVAHQKRPPGYWLGRT